MTLEQKDHRFDVVRGDAVRHVDFALHTGKTSSMIAVCTLHYLTIAKM